MYACIYTYTYTYTYMHIRAVGATGDHHNLEQRLVQR